MLVSVMTATVSRSDDDLRTISSRFLQWASLLLLELQLALWKDIQLEKMSINLLPRWNLKFKESKVVKIPFSQLFMSTMELFILLLLGSYIFRAR